MDERAGRFLVTAADAGTAELADVDPQAVAPASNPWLETGDVVEGTVAPDPPLGVTWSLNEVEARHRVRVTPVDEPPSSAALELAADLATREGAREAIDGGELPTPARPPAETEAAVAVRYLEV